MARYINPFTDFGFKKIFGEEVNKDLPMDFLNELLPEKHRVRELAYKRADNLGAGEADRRAVFDIYCESENGKKIIVKMQKAKQNFFKDRAVFYSTFRICEQAETGDWNFELKAVYCVAILDFVFEEQSGGPQFMHTVQLRDNRNQVFYDKLTFIFLEMPKFDKSEDELQTDFDKWLFFPKNLVKLDGIPLQLRNRIFEKAFNAAEIARFQPEQVQAYEASLKYYRDLKNVIDTAFDQGVALVALNAIREGLPDGLIARLTGLDLETIRTMRQNR